MGLSNRLGDTEVEDFVNRESHLECVRRHNVALNCIRAGIDAGYIKLTVDQFLNDRKEK